MENEFKINKECILTVDIEDAEFIIETLKREYVKYDFGEKADRIKLLIREIENTIY